MVKIVLVVARARNGIIGAGGALPWHLASDLAFFRKTTWGRPMIMGRKTYDSIGKALPGRDTIVMTRCAHLHHEGIIVAHSADEALSLGADCAQKRGADAIMIVGGAEIYVTFMPLAQSIIMTEVNLEPEGDASFPTPDPASWQEISSVVHARGARDDADFVIRRYCRV